MISSTEHPNIHANHTQEHLTQIRAPISSDLAAVDALILEELHSNITLVKTITQHIIKSGGKRLRPLLLMLVARATGYQDQVEHHELAVIIEFVHTATLLHDDVVDSSELRRGKETANAVWGNEASVLVGDFLYSRAFQLLAKRSNIPVMQVLADTTNAIAEGEILQLMNRGSIINEHEYLKVIEYKTAQLFAAASQVGAILGQATNTMLHEKARLLGLHLGLAFQMIDDVLDYKSESGTLGKNSGDDLAEGKMTLPLIYALERANTKDRLVIERNLVQGERNDLQKILQIMENTGALVDATQKALAQAKLAHRALESFSESTFKNSLSSLIDFVTARAY